MNASLARFCPGCGAEREEHDAYCQFCGRALASPNGADANPSRLWVEAQRHMAAGDCEAARRSLDTFEHAAGISGDALALRAVICLRLGDLGEARSLLDQALSSSPQSPFVRVKNAEYWLALGMTDRARANLTRARTLAVGNDALWTQVTRLLESVTAKSRWSFVRGADSPSSACSQPATPPRRKGANAWRS